MSHNKHLTLDNPVKNKFWKNVERLDTGTLPKVTHVLIDFKTGRDFPSFEKAWKFSWLYEHSLTIRILSIIIFIW